MNRLMMKLMGFVVMDEAGADGAPAGGAVPAAAPQAAPAPAAPAADATLLGQAAPAADPAAQQTPEQKAEAEAAAQKLADEKAANSAPEAYADFTLPEGFEMDAGTLDAFKGLAKELNIPQASAQKLIDLQTALSSKQAEAYQASVVAQGQQWAAEIKNDPQLGGENYDKSVASAVKVIQAFGDESLSNLLNESGLGNHPALFKFCHRISAAISEDQFVMPGSQSNKPQQRDADVLFGDLNL